MASYNRIILMGHLTRDPELSYTQTNVAICKFGLATNHKRTDREGNTKETVCFIDCTLFGKSAEVFNEHMAVGRPVLIEGRLEFQQWTTADGGKRSKHAVIVDNFTFVGGKGEGPGSDGRAVSPRVQRPEPAPAPVAAPAHLESTGDDELGF